ncbi:putative membrane protein [Streptococcus pyogenes MGAS2111]|nr:putative membrane protein [Streptococcus pyogenes MGAS2111]
MTTTDKETFSSFMNKVLAGTAIAIVVALIPNAILATFLKPLLPNMAAAVIFTHCASLPILHADYGWFLDWATI